MLKITLSMILLTLSLNVFPESNMEVIYSELKFNLPDNFTLIGDMGGKDNILVFRYGDIKGKNYIAFTDMTNDNTIKYGCSASVFYNDLFSANSDTNCNIENLNIMRNAFIDNKEIVIWRINDYVLNYSSSKDKSFVFLSGKNGKLIKIDSDFIDKKAFKNIFKKL